MFYPTNPSSSIRRLAAKNVGTTTIPPFGPCQIVAEADADCTLKVAGGTANNADSLFNLETPMEPGQGGQVTRSFPVLGAVAGRRPPKLFDSFGTVKGSAFLSPGGVGYTFIGALLNGAALFMPNFFPWGVATDFFEDDSPNDGSATPGNLAANVPGTFLGLTLNTPGAYFFCAALSGRLDSTVTGATPIGAAITGSVDTDAAVQGALDFIVVQRIIDLEIVPDPNPLAPTPVPAIHAAMVVRGNGGTVGSLIVPTQGATLSISALFGGGMFAKIDCGSLLVVGPL